MKTPPFLAVLLLAPCLSHADLQWAQKRLEFHPSAADTEIKAEFQFANPGTTPVTIESIKPECGCTTAVLDKLSYQPGEKGRITAVFIFGVRTGLQEKTIRVNVQGEKEPTTLSIVTHIPEPAKITPSFIFWRTGEAPAPKTIEVTLSPDAGMRVTKVTSSDPKMAAIIEPVQEGRTYKLLVAPADTAAPLAAILYLECTGPSGAARSFTAYAHVKRSTPSPTVGKR